MLKDFDFCVRTRFIFGKTSLGRVGSELSKLGAKRVMIVRGTGNYLFSSGLLGSVMADLRDHGMQVTEYGGVQPNPRLSLVYELIGRARDDRADMLLAIGGGSVIDTAKAVAAGAVAANDVWDFFKKGKKIGTALPVGVILTNPATGSESCAVTVINNTETQEKLLTSADAIRPAIVFMDPELTLSLPAFVTACGVTDMFSHICERYFAPEEGIGSVDRMAEGLLKTLVEVGPRLMREPGNYDDRAEVMWIGTVAHNDTVGIGRTQDWSTHVIANELSALYDTPHGATLSIIMGAWMRVACERKPFRFARYAREVFSVPWDGETDAPAAARSGIERTQEFFRSMGMPTSFAEYKLPTDGVGQMLDRIQFTGGDKSIGGIVRLNRSDVEKIYRMAF
ncbi:MAG: iron-containing alcohol dehydrogenase [Oscillospiraceae bacterium]|nr:iron-containing alcohol dehydrogenase [Oscillospiraceae bacterium]